MWKSRRVNASPLLPEGLRIYAVGDVHGRADLLKQLFSRIDEDLKKHPIAETMHIFLGDYIDRGEDSAAVLDLLIERARTHRMSCLKGNHEHFLSEFLENPGVLRHWAQYGALPTLASYGLGEEPQKIPHDHIRFIHRCRDYFESVRHIFVHAYYEPHLPLHQQNWNTLRWASVPATPLPHCSGKIAIVGLPEDTADPYAGQMAGKVSDNTVQERYQGGAYTVIDYTRKGPAPGRLFGK